jgi:membrane-bound lytic murein transglycosylase
MTHNLRTRLLATFSAALLVATSACQVAKDYGRPLPEGAPALLPLDPGEAPPRFGHDVYAKAEILPALEQSIAWTKKKSSAKFFPIEGVTQERATKSLERFKQLLTECTTPDEFESRVLAEFEVLKSAGWDGRGGGVLYTAYCTPILPGSRTQTAQCRYPLYAKRRRDTSSTLIAPPSKRVRCWPAKVWS